MSTTGPANTKGLIKINSTEITRAVEEIRAGFAAVDENIAKKYRGAAVRAAVKPAFRRFKSLIPVSATGNLQQSAAMVVRNYPAASVALAGYRMNAEGDEDAKGWAQGLIEFGSDDRFTYKNIASSFNANSRGPFTSKWLVGGGGAILQTPPYPWAFFSKAKRGERVELGRMPKGGSRGISPLETAWNTTKGEVRSILLEKMSENVVKAIDENLRRIRKL